MKLYIIVAFDKLLNNEGIYIISGDREISFIFTDEEKAKKCISENWVDFQDGAYKYCALQEVNTDTYLPAYINGKTTFYEFINKKWVQIAVEEGI